MITTIDISPPQIQDEYSLLNTKIIVIKLPNCTSKIVQHNNNTLYAKYYKNKAGIFRKDRDDTLKSGRIICDAVKEACNNNGFFTSDELPRYGINRKDKRQIIAICEVDTSKDLIVLCAYLEAEARRTFEVLDGFVL